MSNATMHMMPPGAIEWLRSGERGVSSEAIFEHLTGVPVGDRWGSTYPADSWDLRRCRLLLEAVPAFRLRLGEMSGACSVWARLVARWDELCALMDEEAPDWRDGQWAPRTYDLMRNLIGGTDA
jgi:hypothetical protein